MASDAPPSEAGAAAAPEDLTITLQLVSPSVTVTRPLLFPDLAATTTVKQLKDKVREALPTQPPNEHQRLIHRGRANLKDTDTLLDIFGESAIRQDANQTMHLVVRDTAGPPPPSRTSPSRRSPAAAVRAGNSSLLQSMRQHQHAGSSQIRSSSSPLNATTTSSHPPPTTGPQQQRSTPDLLSLMQSRNQRVVEAYARAREDRNREAGAQGASTPSNGRASPAAGFHYREAGGPTRQTYRVETTIRTGQPQAQADAAATMTNAMHRSASGASLHSMYNRPLNQPGATLPVNFNGRMTPDPSARSASGGSQTGAASAASSRPAVDVYILSSPEGPRALLVNNGTSETFYSPRLPMQPSYPRLRDVASAYATASGSPAPTQTQQHPQQNQPNQQQRGQAQAQAPAQMQDGQNDRDNPQPPVLPPLLLQLWPHLWLIFRLAIFIWFFTSPNSPWSRWFSVVGLAVGIFVYQAGVLNNVGGMVQPVRQHLQNLLPPMEGQPQRPQDGGNQNPEDMAARLIAQRERENWLQGQIRRIERAGLLFLASIAPGFAEEHIRNLENAARAERQRIEAETEAARRQQEEREQQEAAANGSAENNETSNEEQGAAEGSGPPGTGEQSPRPDAITT